MSPQPITVTNIIAIFTGFIEINLDEKIKKRY